MSDIKRTGAQGGPSSNEEEYFARREAELLRQQREALEKTAAEAERKSHYLKCPKCGFDLLIATGRGGEIEQCPSCRGIWLDATETEAALKGGEEERSRVRDALLAIVQPDGGARGRPGSGDEDYFARRDADLARQQQAARDRPALEAERATHHMKCPKCGFGLLTVTIHSVDLDQCPNCHGIWFDAGEAEQWLKRSDAERGLLRGALLSIVKAVSGTRAKPK
ncbi:MAG TPA: zf-TFIIB domain-containing protein [Gemmatimonadales bacterium]|jgi:Zn-finger nucleic acid-binding protein|nr:zf-TFIIB domain-containing protein [Gemmatimonadales bacterium]